MLWDSKESDVTASAKDSKNIKALADNTIVDKKGNVKTKSSNRMNVMQALLLRGI